MSNFPEVRVKCADEERSGLILVRVEEGTAFVCHPRRKSVADRWAVGFPTTDVFYVSSGAEVRSASSRKVA